MQKLVSKREFARRIGVSEANVRKAIKNGRIFGLAIVGSKLDFDIASSQFKTNKDFSKQRSKPKLIKKSEILNQAINDEPEDLQDDMPFSESELNKQRTRKEKAMADKAELQVEIMREELIETEKVINAVFETIRAIRDHFLRFPDRVSAEIASQLKVDKSELKTLLTEEMKTHCKLVEDIKFNVDDSK